MLTLETEQFPVLDESIPFLPPGWRADRIDDEFILQPGPRGRETSTDPGRGGWSPGSISDDYGPQFPVVGEDIPWPAARDAVASQVGAVRPLEAADQRIYDGR